MVNLLVTSLILGFIGVVQSNEASSSRELQNIGNMDSQLAKAKMVEYISLDTESAIYDDIDHIVHVPDESSIVVTLKKDAKCPMPYLRGRLSGDALAMINWDRQVEGSNTIVGHYEVPFKGYFYLEIIIIFCEHHSRNFENCVVPGENHRLTAMGAGIYAQRETSHLVGFWKSPTHTALYTRFQPANCRRFLRHQERCQSEKVTPFDRYSFHMMNSKLMDRYYNIEAGSETHGNWTLRWDSKGGYNCFTQDEGVCKFCAVGSSHSNRVHRLLSEAAGLERMGGMRKDNPDMVHSRDAKMLMDRCEIIMFGFGQHDMAYRQTRPNMFGAAMARMLKMFKNHPRVYVRSVNYNPLGDEKLMCPPKDNRNPALVDDYNRVMLGVCQEMGIPWVDTRFIVGPMWDSAIDWNHLHWAVEIVNVFYIAEYLGLFENEKATP